MLITFILTLTRKKEKEKYKKREKTTTLQTQLGAKLVMVLGWIICWHLPSHANLREMRQAHLIHLIHLIHFSHLILEWQGEVEWAIVSLAWLALSSHISFRLSLLTPAAPHSSQIFTWTDDSHNFVSSFVFVSSYFSSTLYFIFFM